MWIIRYLWTDETVNGRPAAGQPAAVSVDADAVLLDSFFIFMMAKPYSIPLVALEANYSGFHSPSLAILALAE